VLQMIAAVGAAVGRPLPFDAAPRRIGDPAAVVASPARIRARLGWRARHGLHAIVTSSIAEVAKAA
jgi:UDP-glucose 4-epimerase